MRVLHVVHSNAFYGVERYVATLASAQTLMGDEVTVIGGDPQQMRRVLNSSTSFSPGSRMAQALRSLHQWRGADVVHAHMTDAEFAAAVSRTLFFRDAVVVATRHFAKLRGESRVGHLLAPYIASRIDGQIAISRFVGERIEGASRTIYPSVPAQHSEVVDRRKTILVAQRLEPEKSTDVAIRAFSGSGLAADGWTMEIAGDGSKRGELTDLAVATGVSGAVKFLGRRDDVPQLMASSSALLASTSIEAFGLTVAEAMAAGLPVIAAASGGHLESLPPEQLQYAFAPGDTLAAAQSLRALAASGELRQELAQAGLVRYTRMLTPTAQAIRTREFYADVIAGKW